MIGLLLALHPRSWRARYGQELRALLETCPLTMFVVLDVTRNALAQHLDVHRFGLRVAGASAVSVVVEVTAVRFRLAENILWLPSTPLRALGLAALLLPWAPVMSGVLDHVRQRRTGAGA